MVHGQARRLAAAVLAGPGVAREHRLAGDLATVDVTWDPHIADQPDHARALEDEALGVECPLAELDHLRTLLEQQDGGPPKIADVDRLVARIEDQDPSPDADPGLVAVEPGAVDRRVRRRWGKPPESPGPDAPEPYVRVGLRVHSARIVDGASPRPTGIRPAASLKRRGLRRRRSDSCRGSGPTRP